MRVLVAALVIIVLMAAVIVVQHDQIQQRTDIKNLPVCDYSTVIQVQGLTHEGYYVGMDANRKIVCAQPLTKEGAVVDLGL